MFHSSHRLSLAACALLLALTVVPAFADPVLSVTNTSGVPLYTLEEGSGGIYTPFTLTIADVDPGAPSTWIVVDTIHLAVGTAFPDPSDSISANLSALDGLSLGTLFPTLTSGQPQLLVWTNNVPDSGPVDYGDSTVTLSLQYHLAGKPTQELTTSADTVFRVEDVPVPEPASWLLLSAGWLALFRARPLRYSAFPKQN